MPRKKTTTKKPSTKREKAAAQPKSEEEKPKKPDRYTEAVGRRKTAVARVRLWGGRGEFRVNEKELPAYFSIERFRQSAAAPLLKLKLSDKYRVSAKVLGGGVRAQAEAVRLGLARTLVARNPDFRKRLRKLGYLTRDPRMVERKKYGLKKARKASQWAKR